LTFLRLLFLLSVVAIVTNIGIFYLLYRKQLKGAFDIQRLPSAEQAAKHKAYFRYTCGVLAAVAVGYVIASAIQLPLSLKSCMKGCASFPTRKRCNVRADQSVKLSTLQPRGRQT
jgi:Na+/H+ antiporter NhaD/arsenite permease-like protein